MTLVLALMLAALPGASREVPTEVEPFLRYIVQRRADEGLARLVRDPDDPRDRTVYGGTPEDANIAWLAAAAFRYDWSRHHDDARMRDRAFLLLDRLAEIHADGHWDDGRLGAYFGLHSFASAVFWWLETGRVDETRAASWSAAVARAADEAMALNHRNVAAGNYANPEMYYLSGLAAAWRVSGDRRYLDEALRALRRYDDSILPGGGLPYFHGSSPAHGYQQMVVKSVALLWDLTGDDHALDWLRRLAPYFTRVQHSSGLLTDALQPWLKQTLYQPLNPASPAMLAIALGDGANRHAADVATRVRTDNIAGRLPSFFGRNPSWYNYHHATHAVVALRMLERRPLPEADPPPARRILIDPDYRGVRSHWDAFTAAAGSRRMNDSLAGAAIADPAEPMLPLGAALDGVYFEVLSGPRGPGVSPARELRAQFRTVEWNPQVHRTTLEDVATVGCVSRLCSPYWGDRPWIPGERQQALDEISDWITLQHWTVWRDHLIGLGALTCHADGGDARTADVARVRWRLAPRGRKLEVRQPTGMRLSLSYGPLKLDLLGLSERGGFAFGESVADEGPRRDWSPTLELPAPWSSGDFVQLATHARPVGSDDVVRFKSLREAAAALMLEPGARRGYLLVGSLTRHWRQHELSLPDGVTARVFKRNFELPPVPPGEPAVISLAGGENAIVTLESTAPLAAGQILDALHSGWGRGEQRPQREPVR